VGSQKHGSLLVGDPACGQCAAHALQRCHCLEAFDDLLETEARHERSAAGVQFNHPGRRKLHQRFPDRRARNPETIRKALFIQAFSGLQTPSHDILLDLVPQCFGPAHKSPP
jgi:hypothetical protein